jgi:branched-chain amino acid transport system substrate-binding protein
MRGAALQVAKMFEQRWNAPVTDTTARSFTATIALATAIDEAGSTDPARVRDALRDLDIPAERTILADGAITFDRQGQNQNPPRVLEQVVDDRRVTVYPERPDRPSVRWPLRSGFGL